MYESSLTVKKNPHLLRCKIMCYVKLYNFYKKFEPVILCAGDSVVIS